MSRIASCFYSRWCSLVAVCCGLIWVAIGCTDVSGYVTNERSTSRSGPFLSTPLRVEVSKSFRPLGMNDIIILPLQAADDVLQHNEHGDIHLDILSEELVKMFSVRTSLDLKNNSDRARAQTAIDTLKVNALTAATARQVAQQAGAQGAIFGVLKRYESLEGSRFGSDHPAAVSFQLWLVDAQTGQTHWSASFSDVQQPLSENLFRAPSVLSGGVGYKSAHEITARGFAMAADSLESLRKSPTP